MGSEESHHGQVDVEGNVIMADKEKWMQGAVKHPGALRKELGVKEGDKIPASKLKKAEHSSNPTERKRATLAATFKKYSGKK